MKYGEGITRHICGRDPARHWRTVEDPCLLRVHWLGADDREREHRGTG
jgi:hypothetical protein